MSINDHDQSLVKSEPIEVKEPSPINAPPEISRKAIMDVLNLEKEGIYSDDLDILLDYAKSQNTDNSLEGLKWVIRDLEDRLGSPPFLEDKIKYLTRFAYLSQESKRTQEELDKMRRGHGRI